MANPTLLEAIALRAVANQAAMLRRINAAKVISSTLQQTQPAK